MESTETQLLIAQFIPLMILQILYAVIVFIIAKKRRLNPWVWTIGSVVPLLGTFIAGIFMLLSFMSVFDRLNTLEAKATFD